MPLHLFEIQVEPAGRALVDRLPAPPRGDGGR